MSGSKIYNAVRYHNLSKNKIPGFNSIINVHEKRVIFFKATSKKFIFVLFGTIYS